MLIVSRASMSFRCCDPATFISVARLLDENRYELYSDDMEPFQPREVEIDQEPEPPEEGDDAW